MTINVSLTNAEISFLVPFLKERMVLYGSSPKPGVADKASVITGILAKLAPPVHVAPAEPELLFAYFVTLSLPGRPVSFWNQDHYTWFRNRAEATQYPNKQAAEKQRALLCRSNINIRPHTEATLLTISP
jgi:hypothetical protein